MSEELTKLCPCGSGKNYADCCESIIKGTRLAETPEELMRARYSAYVKGEIDFIIDSTCAEKHNEIDRKGVEEWSKSADWQGLQVLNTAMDDKDSNKGYVEFICTYAEQGRVIQHHEFSEFHKVGGKWLFFDGQLAKLHPFERQTPKISPNAPCPCGSGKKYKKCCGK